MSSMQPCGEQHLLRNELDEVENIPEASGRSQLMWFLVYLKQIFPKSATRLSCLKLDRISFRLMRHRYLIPAQIRCIYQGHV